MKRCSYCGAENPDDATVCLIDQRPLSPETPVPHAKPLRAKRPRAKPSRSEMLAHMASRPWEVTFAITLMVLDLIFSIIQEAIHWWPYHRYLNFRHPDSICYFIGFVCVYGIYVFLYNCIYRGKNWVRWLMSCLLLLAIISIPFIFHGGLHWDFYLHSLIELIAIAALFQRPSNEWFKGPKVMSTPVALAS